MSENYHILFENIKDFGRNFRKITLINTKFGKTACQNSVAMETSNHVIKKLTHHNVPRYCLGKVLPFCVIQSSIDRSLEAQSYVENN